MLLRRTTHPGRRARRALLVHCALLAIAGCALLGIVIVFELHGQFLVDALLAGFLALGVATDAGLVLLLQIYRHVQHAGMRLLACLGMAWLVLTVVGSAGLITATVLQPSSPLEHRLAQAPLEVFDVAYFGGFLLAPIWLILGAATCTLLYWVTAAPPAQS